MCPGNKRSAGKNYSGRTPQGNAWLSGILTECGWVVRRAVGHSILVIAWHILSKPGTTYDELGADYLQNRVNPERERSQLLSRLKALGLEVEIREPEA
jgi:hypothetical protein